MITECREPLHRRHRIANATPRNVYDVLVDFADYPAMFPDFRQTRILAEMGSIVRVEFRTRFVLPVRFVLDLTCQPDVPSVDWTFVEGDVVSGSVGSWRLVAEAGATVLDYTCSLDVRAPLPRCVLRGATNGLVVIALPLMFASIEREVRRRNAQTTTSTIVGLAPGAEPGSLAVGACNVPAVAARVVGGRSAGAGPLEPGR